MSWHVTRQSHSGAAGIICLWEENKGEKVELGNSSENVVNKSGEVIVSLPDDGALIGPVSVRLAYYSSLIMTTLDKR